jgi:hypothetical protein
VKRKVDLPGGGTATVTVQSSDPIDERDYLILRPQAATEMSYCLVSMANTLRPPDSPEIELTPRAASAADRTPPDVSR